MKKVLRRMMKIVTAVCMLAAGACEKKPVGTIEEDGAIVIEGIRYVEDPAADISSLAQGSLQGKVRGYGREYDVYRVKGDYSSEVFICVSGSEKKVFRKEKEEVKQELGTVGFDGKEMNYLRIGDREKEKVILLPGMYVKSVMGAADAIAAAYSPLTDRYEVILLERVREIPAGYTAEDMADDTLKAMTEMDIDAANFIGVSMGGAIAQLIALKKPAAVITMTLCSSFPYVTDTAAAVFETWHALASGQDASGLMNSFGENVYTPSFFEQYKDAILAQKDRVSGQDLLNFERSIDSLADFDLRGRLDEIRCPVFVIGAGEDRVVGPEAYESFGERPYWRKYLYEDRGHGVYDEVPDYLGRIQQFLLEVHSPVE